MRSRYRLLVARVALVLVCLFLTLATAEIALRIYNPFPSTVRGEKIYLPVHRRFTVINKDIPTLDRVIYVTRNSLGFRGPEPPQNARGLLSIIAVGGSTTACFLATDGKDWPAFVSRRLAESSTGVWVNNAGLDGHSTVGHLVLLNGHILRVRPKVVLFLLGANDFALAYARPYDMSLVAPERRLLRRAAFAIAEHSEAVSLVINLRRYADAREARVVHRSFDLHKLSRGAEDAAAVSQLIKACRERHLPEYAKRVLALVDLCRRNGIQPVFITQPALYGNATDDITKVDLGAVQVTPTMSGRTAWQILELYNDQTRRVSRQTGAALIELAHALPKSSRYFYDFIHFTNDGQQKVADIVFEGLSPVLRKHFPAYKRDSVRAGSAGAGQ